MTIEIEYNGHEFEVSGTVTPYRPAVMYLSNGDPGYPAEGGEIEDMKISMMYRRKDKGAGATHVIYRPLPDKLADKLANDSRFLDTVYAALDEIEEEVD